MSTPTSQFSWSLFPPYSKSGGCSIVLPETSPRANFAKEWLEANPEIYFEEFSSDIVPTNPDVIEVLNPDTLADSIPDVELQWRGTETTTSHEMLILKHFESMHHLLDAEWTR